MSIEREQAALTGMQVKRDTSVVKWSRTAAYTSDTMEVFEQVVLIDTDTVDGTFTVTLPPVAEAAGKFYAVHLVDDGGDVTVQDQDDSYDWSNQSLTADDDGVLLFSDGLKWWLVVDNST